MSTTLMGMLGMLCHNLQQRLPEILKEKPKEQTLFTLSTDYEWFEEELLEFDVEVVTIDMNDELMIEEFFDMNAFEQNQNVSDESSDTFLQNATDSTEDWSIDKIFFQSKV
ncbi:8687_t:CDS:2 [Racocetra fulgida]|uniref:8687_t:CDS:1 n=1 Tax=Racocetra fulgida TaxID=60492 RepID=A0A9N8ZTC8_9GLOM|nr:8687_t:CDS:2 [Racocetra fulgida]